MHSIAVQLQSFSVSYSYFGARYYDPNISIWLSVDPLSDKYPSMSPYAYTANNPIIFTDPDGNKIVVSSFLYKPPSQRSKRYNRKLGRSSQFVQQTFKGLDYLYRNPDNGNNRVQSLVNANNTLVIQENSDYPGADSYDPYSKTMRFSPDVGAEYGDGSKDAPVVTLAHEIVHADESIKGWDKYDQAVNAGQPNNIQDQLFREATQRIGDPEAAAMDYENVIRGSSHKREDYSKMPSRFFYTKGVLSIDPANNVSVDKMNKLDKMNMMLKDQ